MPATWIRTKVTRRASIDRPRFESAQGNRLGDRRLRRGVTGRCADRLSKRPDPAHRRRPTAECGDSAAPVGRLQRVDQLARGTSQRFVGGVLDHGYLRVERTNDIQWRRRSWPARYGLRRRFVPEREISGTTARARFHHRGRRRHICATARLVGKVNCREWLTHRFRPEYCPKDSGMGERRGGTARTVFSDGAMSNGVRR